MLQNVPKTSWLLPEEQREVVQRLLEYGLIRFDNNRGLPLKSGGTTDIYIDLRLMRDNPDAIAYLAQLFANPLRRLGVSRFAEIPEAVSPLASALAIESRIPYLTIRETPKEGRVSDAKVVGTPRRAESIGLIDDVVTDGESKIIPYEQCLAMGLFVRALLVLVDRQQGWEKKFDQRGVNMPVWAGMKLHDVRRELIASGRMRRCDPAVEKKNPIILALDGKEWGEILPTLDLLRTTGCKLKVNDLMFAEGFDHLLPELAPYGRVMVDLKGHDIKNTVGNTCRRLRKHAPWAVTVHASGERDMIAAAVKELAGTPTMVLAVTVLTCFDAKMCQEVYRRRPKAQVLALAKIAAEAGAHGFVCSPEELPMLRKAYPQLKCITPGIRSEGADVGEQKRVATPKGAMDAGSDGLVMGRQVLQDAPDPVAEVKRVLTDELGISLD